MGQQQLLLIVLGLIIIAVAIIIGVDLFTASSIEKKRELLINECVNMANLAQQYYNKPLEMGGGNQSYIGWTIPAELDSTTSGTYIIEDSNNSELILMGTPFTEKGYNWYIKSTITKEDIVTEIIP